MPSGSVQLSLRPMLQTPTTGKSASSHHYRVGRCPLSSALRTPPSIDAGLSSRFRNGDEDAVRAVYSTYGRLVYVIAYRILGERGLCEEATQQTFLKAWRAAGSIDPGRELGPWLATIARRVSIDIYRREGHRASRRLDDVPANDPALVSPAVTVEETYDVWEVRRAVSLLPDDEREVVRAQHFEGLTHAQIAARMGVPVGTVKSRSFRAHRRLASELGHLRQRGWTEERTGVQPGRWRTIQQRRKGAARA
jgi:RNA polymerase sigma factor (sigma-70 family)